MEWLWLLLLVPPLAGGVALGRRTPAGGGFALFTLACALAVIAAFSPSWTDSDAEALGFLFVWGAVVIALAAVFAGYLVGVFWRLWAWTGRDD